MPLPMHFGRVHADLKIGAENFAVLFDHALDAKLLQTFGGGGHADESAPVFGHEIDGGGRGELRGHEEVAFVLAVGIVHDDHHFAALDVGNDGFDAVESGFHLRQKVF